MDIHEGEILVDVGCGDGSFLRQINQLYSVSGWGVVPTLEEQQRLENLYKCAEMKFFTGLVQELPFEDECADKVVCNGVLILLESENEVRRGLTEIVRIARPGALVWIGEIPNVDEGISRNYGQSLCRWLWHVWTHQGFLAFWSRLQNVISAYFGSAVFIIQPKNLFFATPEAVVAMAGECGLSLVKVMPHEELDESGAVVISQSRMDYLFRKV